jgi:hypothetical protein
MSARKNRKATVALLSKKEYLGIPNPKPMKMVIINSLENIENETFCYQASLILLSKSALSERD